MSRVLRSELFCIFRNIRFYVYLAAILIIQALFCIFAKEAHEGFFIFVPILLSIVVTFDIAHKDFKLGTMKNIVGSGIRMESVYLGKLFASLISSLIIFLVYVLSLCLGALALGSFANLNVALELVSIIPYLGQIAVVFFVCSIVTSGAFCIIIAIAYMIGLPIALEVINNDVIKAIRPYELNAISNEIVKSGFTSELWLHMLVALVLVAVISVLGRYLFTKHSIK